MSEGQKIQRGNRVLSYLPLSHILGLMADVFFPMINRGTTFFADKKALKGSLVDNLLWCRPTEFIGVPRVWEKIMEGMKAKGRDLKGLRKTISMNAKVAGIKYHLEGGNDMAYKIFNKLVFSKVRKALGLDQCRIFGTGAAPMEKEVEH